MSAQLIINSLEQKLANNILKRLCIYPVVTNYLTEESINGNPV
jgi:hypothetical protein